MSISIPGEATIRFRERVSAIWRELCSLDGCGEFGNIEGGSVEQQRDRRLQLHHCANYAAVLTILSQTGQTSPTGQAARLRLLELGCGSGALTFAFARAMPPGWSIIATDYSEKLLSGARRRYRLDNLSFEHLDVRTIQPGRLGQVDAVFLLEVIEHLPQAEAARLLHNVHAAMRPGGRLVMTTLDRAPFTRPFSGYAPHFHEYDHGSMSAFLSDPRNSPFRRFSVGRLVSERIAQEAVSSENRGGYVVNRFQRLVLGLGNRHHEFTRLRERTETAAFRLYSRLPRSDGFDFPGYLGTLDFLPDGAGARDRDSFGLVVVLEKD